MNDLDYAKMIEIPVNSYDVTYKKPRRYKWKRPESLKEQLISSVNEEIKDETNVDENEFFQTVNVTTVEDERRREKKNKKFSLDVVSAQIAVIVVLALTIMLTNIFWQDSGINSLIKGVFATSGVEIENRVYTDFVPSAPSRTAEVSLSDGVMVMNGAGSVYPVCDGKITKVAENAGKYDIFIEYSQSFTSIISGVDYAFYNEGDAVYGSLPVCYSSGDEVKVFLYDNGKLLTDYTLDNGKIVWQS